MASCKRGHARTEENTYQDSHGNLHCRVCRRYRQTNAYKREREGAEKVKALHELLKPTRNRKRRVGMYNRPTYEEWKDAKAENPDAKWTISLAHQIEDHGHGDEESDSPSAPAERCRAHNIRKCMFCKGKKSAVEV